MARMMRRDIPVLIIRGPDELGRLTGFSNPRTHEKWRNAGLKYMISERNEYLYEPDEVVKFLRKHYAPQKLKESLTNEGNDGND